MQTTSNVQNLLLPNRSGFKLASLNITSLVKHIDELRIYLSNNVIDVLAINETRLDSTVGDNEVHIPGYEIVRRDRDSNGRFGGGVCFYIRSCINFSVRHDLSFEQLENLCISVNKPRAKPFLITTWYRPPNSPVAMFNYFEILLGMLDSENIEYYLMGDFNCDLSSTVLDHDSKSLMDIADLYNLSQLINEPTRITDSSSTLLDHIFTNTPDKVVCSGVSHVSISDHSLIYAFRKLSVGSSTGVHSSINYRKFKNFDSTKFRNDISQQSWNYINQYENPNDMWHAWKATFNSVADKHAPIRAKRVKAIKSPWITSLLKDKMHRRDVLKIKAIRSNDTQDWLSFKKMRNFVNSEIFYAKQAYFKNSFNDNKDNPNKTWKIINELTSKNRKSPHIGEVDLNGVLINDPSKIADAFNDHFSNIGPDLADKINLNYSNRSYLDYLPNQNNAIFQLREISIPTVYALLSTLSTSKATGLDKISSRLIRECSDLIAESLCLIFNRSITTGIFPNEWKCAKVIPIYKQGKRNCVDNYRPISIVPIVAKVFERVIYDQLYIFIAENELLTNYQSGFRGLHSTVTSLLEATNEWAYNIDSGNVNAVMFLDLKKAFDTVDHEILLNKLNAYGIKGTAGNWLRSYLNERNQKCFVNGHFSSNRLLQCGVPQGTILGPLLFLIYINDLPNCLIHSRARMFADDTNLTYASNNIHEINHNLNEDLANVSEWLSANKLTLNQTKTEFMLIGSRQRINTFQSTPLLVINNVPVKQVSHTKSLGVHIDENLSWNVHIEKLSKKVASGIGALKRIRPYVPFTTMQLIYKCLVQPYFDYCSAVWDSCSSYLVNKLQKLQNRAARVLTSSSYDTNADYLFESLGWKNLVSQRRFTKAIMVYKSLNGLAPDYLSNMFVDRNSITNYALRDTSNKLALSLPRTNYLKNSFSYSGAVLWNSLPTELRQASTLHKFKSDCSNFIQ